MSVRWERFAGDTSAFAVRLAFHPDPDDGKGADLATAASWGSIQVWVDGINLCSHLDQGETLQASHWYLLSALEWLAAEWNPLLHEERLPSHSKTFGSAIDVAHAWPSLLLGDAASERALGDDARRFDWEQRHSLRSARNGGLFPDLRLRRLRDTIEVSWTNVALAGAGGVEFVAQQGTSVQDSTQVGDALYQILSESVAQLRRELPHSDRISSLSARVAALRSDGLVEERTAWLAGLGETKARVVERWRSIVSQVKGFATPAAFAGSFVPSGDGQLVLSGSCEAALLFGCISPTINDNDAMALARLILQRFHPSAIDGLVDLVQDAPIDSRRPAWEDGYELAASVLEDAGQQLRFEFIEIEGFLKARGIAIETLDLSDSTIRAVSLASPDHLPTIALNTSSAFYSTSAARRFTLAHELCHLLFDRSSGARLAVASGPWAPRAIEQRANAFAAMLLMPPDLVRAVTDELEVELGTSAGLAAVARRLGVGAHALLEHSHNLALMDDSDHEQLRVALERTE